MSNPTTFIEIEKERAALVDEKESRIAEHAAWLKTCDERLASLKRRTILLSEGADLARIDRARGILMLEGDPSKTVCSSDGHGRDTRASAITDAKRWLAENPVRLRQRYIGVKNYSGFGDQREDHEYGFGPRHGNIVFRIGLSAEARKRELTTDEIEDALYLLHVWPAIAEAQKKAA